MKTNTGEAWRLTRSIQMYPAASGQDPEYLVPHLLPVAGTTLVRHPSSMDARWLAAHVASTISHGGNLAPFPPARKAVTTFLTSFRKGYETSKLMRLLARPNRWSEDDNWLHVLHARHGQPVTERPAFNLNHPESLPFCQALVIDDVRLLMSSSGRALKDARQLQALLEEFAALNKAGIAVLAFIPQVKNEPIFDAEAIFINSIQLRLEPDPGGAKERGASLLVHREKTSPVDPTLTYFRWYFVLPAPQQAVSEPELLDQMADDTPHRGSTPRPVVGFDVPKSSEAEQERKDDRQHQIEYLIRVKKMKPADIARELKIHPSTVSRRLRELGDC